MIAICDKKINIKFVQLVQRKLIIGASQREITLHQKPSWLEVKPGRLDASGWKQNQEG